MDRDLRGLSVSLDSMGFTQTQFSLSKDEIATIEAARFAVPVVADAYEIRLTEHEQTMAVPQEFTQRVSGSSYTWVMYKADSIPDLRVGLQGDVWVDSTSSSTPRIFVFGERGIWHEWDDAPDPARISGHPPPAPDLKSVVAVHHPWLRHRRLEFDGVALRWGIVDQHGESDMDRLEREVAAAGWPKYGDIPLGRVAERLCTAAPPTHGRVIIPASKPASVEWWKKPVDPAYVWRSPPTSPSTAGPSQSRSPPAERPSHPGRPLVFNPDAFSLAKKAFPPPGSVPLSPAFRFPPLYAPAPVEVVVKTEEEEENAVLAQLQRTRESASPLPPPQQPPERIKAEPDDSNSSLAQTTGLSIFAPPSGFFSSAGTSVSAPISPSAFFGPAAQALVSRTVFDPQNAFSTAAVTTARPDMSQFLASLPLPVTRHEPVLGALGIRSMKYLKSFADAPPSVLSKLTSKLQEQGFTFMEALVLRDGLSSLRDEAAAAVPQPAAPESVHAFLAAMKPSMARHTPVFAALGIDVAHLPILARLDAAPYGEFEQALLAKGVPWADAFLIEVALKTRVLS